MSEREPFLREDGTRYEPGDPDCLRALVNLGILEVVEEADDEGDVMYRMIDPEGVGRALAELGA
jgi:hypothetical protein